MASPNRYRFILGMTPDTSVNLVTNGTFTGGLTGWTVDANTYWSSVANTAECVGSVGGPVDYNRNKLTQANIVSPGNYYYLSYDLKKATAPSGFELRPGRVTPSVGGLYYNHRLNYDQNNSATFVSQVHEMVFCGQGTNLEFYCFSTRRVDDCAIDNVLLYRYVWNSPLTYEPINWDEAKITKERDDVFNGLIVNYIADLTFIEDGYDYLYAQYVANGYCGEVPVLIEVWNSVLGVYEEFFKGFIFINECNFNLTTRQVTVSIVDSNASQIFINNKDVKVDLIPEQDFTGANPYAPGTGDVYAAPSPYRNILINDSSGSTTTGCIYDEKICFNVYDSLRKIIMVSSDYRLDFDSSFFSYAYPPATFGNLCITTGYYLRGATLDFFNQDNLVKLSIDDLFTELNKLFNLSFSIDNSGVIPKVLIEPKIDYLNSSIVLSLGKVKNVEMAFDESSSFRSINIGYRIIDSSATGNGANTPNGYSYRTDLLCTKDELNLVSDWIQSSDIIQGLIPCLPTITHKIYDKTVFWLETDGTTSKSSANVLNPNIDYDDNMGRWVETLQGTVFETTLSDPNESIKTNTPLPLNFSFEYPITKAQFDLIQQAYNTIQFDLDGTGTTTRVGYLLKADYNIKTGLTEFKLLSS